MHPMLFQFLFGVGLQIVGGLFGPKPEQPKPPHLSDWDEPTADSSRPVPKVFGTVMVTGLNALWWGDKAINRRDVKFPMHKK